MKFVVLHFLESPNTEQKDSCVRMDFFVQRTPLEEEEGGDR